MGEYGIISGGNREIIMNTLQKSCFHQWNKKNLVGDWDPTFMKDYRPQRQVMFGGF